MKKYLLPLYRRGIIATLLIVFGAPNFSGAEPRTAQPVPSRSPLPRLGEAGGLDLVAERQIGDRIAQQLLRSPDYLDDPVLQDYLQSVWQPLLATARASGEIPPDLEERFAWQTMLVRDSTVNAFALPGGYLGVHTGLLATVGSADELASVLSHELSHVTQRHISRMVAHQERQTPWIVAAMVLGALAASKAQNADMIQAAVVGGQAVAAQSQLNFSRDMEREADRVGFGVMTGAGFDGKAFVTMFDRLQQASRLNDDGSFPYLRTHPLTTERMADMKSRQPVSYVSDANAGERSAMKVQPDALWHGLMAARARVLGETEVQRLRTWSVLPTGGRTGPDTATVYAAALSQARLKDTAQALSTAQHLLGSGVLDGRSRTAVELLILEIGLMDLSKATVSQNGAGSAGNASVGLLADKALRGPDRASVLTGAQVFTRLGRPAEAAERLQIWVTLHPKDAAAWGLLAQAWAAQGQTLRAIRAEAESKAALQDLGAAIDRLQSARDFARDVSKRGAEPDHYEMSIIDARWRELTQAQREQAQAERRQP